MSQIDGQATGHAASELSTAELKQKYRLRPPAPDAHPAEAGVGLFEVDDAGNRVSKPFRQSERGCMSSTSAHRPPHRPLAAAPGEAAPDVQT